VTLSVQGEGAPGLIRVTPTAVGQDKNISGLPSKAKHFMIHATDRAHLFLRDDSAQENLNGAS
jgi:hypothetical protein